MVKEVGLKLVELLDVVGSKGRWSMERAARWLIVKLTSSLIYSQGGEMLKLTQNLMDEEYCC